MVRNALRWWVGFALLGSVGFAPLLARAGDGRIEISQAAIDAAGGFPYSISTSGSYVLTSDLVVPNANLDALEVSSAGVTIDLNGFSIRGPVTCSASGGASTTTCTASGTGSGIFGGYNLTVRNGRVTGMGNRGILSAAAGTFGTVIEDVRVDNNAQGGIRLDNGTLRHSFVARNGGPGVDFSDAGDSGSSTLVESNVIFSNKGVGVGLSGQIVGNRIGSNGGAGILHSSAGGNDSLIAGNQIDHNEGKAINAYGTYRDNEIVGNDAVGGQVIGGMTDVGGNRIH